MENNMLLINWILIPVVTFVGALGGALVFIGLSLITGGNRRDDQEPETGMQEISDSETISLFKGVSVIDQEMVVDVLVRRKSYLQVAADNGLWPSTTRRRVLSSCKRLNPKIYGELESKFRKHGHCSPRTWALRAHKRDFIGGLVVDTIPGPGCKPVG
jgi:hypothetical protein